MLSGGQSVAPIPPVVSSLMPSSKNKTTSQGNGNGKMPHSIKKAYSPQSSEVHKTAIEMVGGIRTPEAEPSQFINNDLTLVLNLFCSRELKVDSVLHKASPMFLTKYRSIKQHCLFKNCLLK